LLDFFVDRGYQINIANKGLDEIWTVTSGCLTKAHLLIMLALLVKKYELWYLRR